MLDVYALLGDIFVDRYQGRIDIGRNALIAAQTSFCVFLLAAASIVFMRIRSIQHNSRTSDLVDTWITASFGLAAFFALNASVLYRPLVLDETVFKISGGLFALSFAAAGMTLLATLAITRGWTRSHLVDFLRWPFQARNRDVIINGTLVVTSVLLSLTALETFARFYWESEDSWTFRNFALHRPALLQHNVTKIDYHPVLGWVLKPNITDSPPRSDANRYRINGPDSLSHPVGGTILVTGDSFANGSGVDDHQTWSALLEKFSGVPVANGANGGWGMDQAFLRVTEDYDGLKPPLVIFAFIDGDTIRNGLKIYSGGQKPFYEISDGKLVLKNVPVPPYVPNFAPSSMLGRFRHIFGYSYFVHRLALGLGFGEQWRYESWEYEYTNVDGTEIGCLLMNELREFERNTGSRVVVFAQYPQMNIETFPKDTGRILGCARDQGLFVVDMYERLRAEYDAAEEKDAFFLKYWFFPGDQHHNIEGNRFSAEVLFQAVQPLIRDIFGK